MNERIDAKAEGNARTRNPEVLTFACRWRCGPPAPSYHVTQTGGITSSFPAQTAEDSESHMA